MATKTTAVTGALVALALTSFALPAAAAAQQPVAAAANADAPADPHAVQPERPTVATHAGTVAPGWVEIEAGVERDRIDPTAASSMTSYINSYTTPFLVKVGLADRVQLGLFGSWARPVPNVSGVGDVGANVKWRLLEGAPFVGDFALLGAAKIPTGSARSGTGTGTTDASLLAISSHDFGPFSLDINVGYTERTGNGTSAPNSSSVWAVSSSGPFMGQLGWALECYGYPGTTGPAGRAPIVAALGGPTFLVRPWLVIDAGAIVPMSGPQPRAFYAGGVYNVGRLWRRRT
jgi:hypothetical protein